jgi:hypothetical protein
MADLAPPVATITVAGAERPYRDAIVSVALPTSLLAGRPFQLFDVSAEPRLPALVQIEPSTGKTAARLWFKVAGDVSARSARRYELHDGQIDAELAERMWLQFAEPLKAVIDVEP